MLLLRGPDWLVLSLPLIASVSPTSHFSSLTFLTYEIGAVMPTS